MPTEFGTQYPPAAIRTTPAPTARTTHGSELLLRELASTRHSLKHQARDAIPNVATAGLPDDWRNRIRSYLIFSLNGHAWKQMTIYTDTRSRFVTLATKVWVCSRRLT